MSMTVSTHEQDGKTVVSVAGEVDVSNAGDLRDTLSAVLAQGESDVQVELSNVPYIDSTGIGVLVGAAHRAADANRAFAVLNPQRNVARVLAMLGVDGELGVGA